jgi:hypothetical protein
MKQSLFLVGLLLLHTCLIDYTKNCVYRHAPIQRQPRPIANMADTSKLEAEIAQLAYQLYKWMKNQDCGRIRLDSIARKQKRPASAGRFCL